MGSCSGHSLSQVDWFHHDSCQEKGFPLPQVGRVQQDLGCSVLFVLDAERVGEQPEHCQLWSEIPHVPANNISGRLSNSRIHNAVSVQISRERKIQSCCPSVRSVRSSEPGHNVEHSHDCMKRWSFSTNSVW